MSIDYCYHEKLRDINSHLYDILCVLSDVSAKLTMLIEDKEATKKWNEVSQLDEEERNDKKC